MNKMCFISGAISGAIVSALIHLAFFRPPPPPHFPPNPADLERILIERFSADLSLSETQKSVAIPVLMKLHRKMLELRLAQSEEEKRVLDEIDNELTPLLSEEQRVLLARQREHMDRFHKHGRDFLRDGPKRGPQ